MMGSRRSVVIHAHFYQPPREDPWLDLVEREANAAPWHDWNERIERECYRPVLAARVPGPDGTILSIENTLEWISFNVGPTLLEWLEHAAPDTYQGILAADKASQARLGGHGNAIAMPYHHIILPLASRREKDTEIRWGLTDFRRRFGRDAAGLWLPETAVDEDTLDAAAAAGVAFVVLAPHQMRPLPSAGRPGLYRTSSGRTIALFPYDGAMAHDVAFGPLIRDADQWQARYLAPPLPQVGPLLHAIATDGETYGHHHKFGEMALAAVLRRLRTTPETRIENFASFLARHSAVDPVALVEPTSWSCAHGIERWRSDCGCRLTAGTSQAWRGPLRAALEWLAEELHAVFGSEGLSYFPDPWAARATYGITGAPSDVAERGRELIELARNALRMFTSCGWFFDDLGGLETLQILKYAGRAIDLSGPSRARLEAEFVARLTRAQSNDPKVGTGADAYRRLVRPQWPPEVRAAAGFAAAAALRPSQVRHVIGGYLVGTLGESMVQTQHRRTGHLERFATQVLRPERLTVEVILTRSQDARPIRVGPEAMPEYERDVVREAIRREALRDVLEPEQLVAVAHGQVSYHDALREAVTRLVPVGPGQVTEAGPARLQRALDLLALEGLPIPFDAQTRFYRLLRELDPDRASPWRRLAPSLGFAPEVIVDRIGS